MYSALNVGFTLGSLVGGIALAFESITLLTAVPWFTAAVFMVNAWSIATRLPKAPHDLKTADERRVKIAGPGPMRNVGWLAVTFFTGVMWTNQVILNLVIPLWLVEKTDAPWVVLAFLFGTNTVMCIFLPMAAARGVRDTRTALRAIRVSAVFFVVSCVITLTTHESIGWVTIALFFAGHVTLTGAELFLSAASWTFEAELMDPRRRGEYQGAAELGGTLGRVWAPAVFTFLAMNWGATGWLIIGGLITAAAAGLHPATTVARRFLEQHVPADVLADAAAGDAPDEEDVPPVGPPTVEQPASPGRPGSPSGAVGPGA
jgi:MFS family permease